MRYNIFFAFAIGMSAVACKSTQQTTETKDVEIVQPISATDSQMNLGLENTEWRLVEVIGKSIEDYGDLNKVPTFIFDASTKRLSGNAGCNNMSASYELLEGNRIQISQGISTKMACPNMQLEDQVGQMLSTLDTYIINDAGELILTKARMAPMLKFVAVK